MAVEHVAKAIVGAVEQGKGCKCFLLGDENLSREELLTRFGRFLDNVKQVYPLPDGLVRLAAGEVRLWH